MTKKTILLTCILATTTVSAETDWQRELVYGLDFNGSAPESTTGLTINNVADKAYAGTTEFTKINGTNFNYASDVFTTNPGSEHLYGHSVVGATFALSDDEGINGLNNTRGFAINVMGKSAATKAWQDLYSFTYGGVSFRLEYTGTNNIALYNSSGLTAIELNNMGGRGDEWISYGLSVSGSSLTFTAIDSAGTILDTRTVDYGFNDTAALTYVQGGGTGRYNTIYMDDFSIYNGSLENKHFELLAANSYAGNGVAQHIPEPATASLSLLALAGLMARRRRKTA